MKILILKNPNYMILVFFHQKINPYNSMFYTLSMKTSMKILTLKNLMMTNLKLHENRMLIFFPELG